MLLRGPHINEKHTNYEKYNIKKCTESVRV